MHLTDTKRERLCLGSKLDAAIEYNGGNDAVVAAAGFSIQKRSNLNMGFGNRDKPEKKKGRAGFVEGRLDELRRRWELATTEREKADISEQIREWQSFRPERTAPSGGRR